MQLLSGNDDTNRLSAQTAAPALPVILKAQSHQLDYSESRRRNYFSIYWRNNGRKKLQCSPGQKCLRTVPLAQRRPRTQAYKALLVPIGWIRSKNLMLCCLWELWWKLERRGSTKERWREGDAEATKLLVYISKLFSKSKMNSYINGIDSSSKTYLTVIEQGREALE